MVKSSIVERSSLVLVAVEAVVVVAAIIETERRVTVEEAHGGVVVVAIASIETRRAETRLAGNGHPKESPSCNQTRTDPLQRPAKGSINGCFHRVLPAK